MNALRCATRRTIRLLAVVLCGAAVSGHAAERYVKIPGGVFRTALPSEGTTTRVAPFRLRTAPVSNGEFAAFVRLHPEWRRGAVPTLFADARYLLAWKSVTDYAPQDAGAPVTSISWFAANAYCASEHARLPTWYEWEFVAAADEQRRDARDDPVWREDILGWYARPASMSLPAVAQDHPNIYGVHNMNRLIWEWVEDYNGLFVTVDSRNQGEQKLLESCGAAALSLGDRDNYAVLMRVALLSSVSGSDNLETMGFRCARDH